MDDISCEFADTSARDATAVQDYLPASLPPKHFYLYVEEAVNDSVKKLLHPGTPPQLAPPLK